MIGPGKYDDILAKALESAGATEGLLMVFNGNAGPGVSCKVLSGNSVLLPDLLRHIAEEMERDNREIEFRN